MKFSVFANDKQANNATGYSDKKGFGGQDHTFSTFGEAVAYARQWIGKIALSQELIAAMKSRDAYYTCLNTGKVSWKYDADNTIEIRREE
jgi:hypothetical protein